MRNVPIKDVLNLALAAVYLFSFRESTKTAAEWGAFQFKDNRLFWRKYVLCSVPLLVIAPLVLYIPFAKAVATLPIALPAGGWELTRDVGAAAAAIVLFGLFPRATKHIWSLVASQRTDRAKVATMQADSGAGWISPTKTLNDLPHPWYSWQVVVCLGIFPIVILVQSLFSRGFRIVAPTDIDLRNLFVATYVGECVVLHHVAKLKGYYYASSRPRWLISMRMLVTVPCTIVLPLGFGVLWYLWMIALAQESNPYRIAFGVFWLLMGLLFPFYCNQSVLLIAQPRGWGKPELYASESGRWFWRTCAVLAVVCAIGMIYLSVTF